MKTTHPLNLFILRYFVINENKSKSVCIQMDLAVGRNIDLVEIIKIFQHKNISVCFYTTLTPLNRHVVFNNWQRSANICY